MATDPAATPPTPPAPPAAKPAPVPARIAPGGPAPATFWKSFVLGQGRPGEYAVYHHSTLFYWWPIWVLALLFALMTWLSDRHMAVVPDGSQALAGRDVELADGSRDQRDVIVLKKGEKHVTRLNAAGEPELFQPTVYMHPSKGMGTMFVIILLLVVIITNITMRGLWSVFVSVSIVMLSIIFAVAGWWDTILARLGQLAIYINLGGYITIAFVLFVIWFCNFFIFDRQTYMIFTPGQVRVCLEVGGGETVYDTTGMVVHKERGDLFRHWILGFGSGDLIVRPVALGYALDMPNVLRVGHVVKMIERMVKERVVVSGDQVRS
jgi:hypothetical protein